MSATQKKGKVMECISCRRPSDAHLCPTCESIIGAEGLGELRTRSAKRGELTSRATTFVSSRSGAGGAAGADSAADLREHESRSACQAAGTPSSGAEIDDEIHRTTLGGGAELKGHEAIRAFIMGGNATFTLYNTKKGTHLTYRVRKWDKAENVYFVNVLTGPSNEEDFEPLGVINERGYWHRKNARITREAPSAQAFEWFWNNMHRLPLSLKVMHEGRCGRCGRKLTVPESISSGFGPECLKIIGA